MQGFKRVLKYEFEEFVRNYKTDLHYNVAGMFEPPLASYNDFELSDKWPDSAIAYINLYSVMGKDGLGRPYEDEYYIREF